MSMRELHVIDLGLTQYKSAWDLQRRLFDLRVHGKIPDTLLLTEHHHVYTLGKSSDGSHLLAGESELVEKGAEVYHVDRGGDITYHGPGQLVGYPILDLNNFYCDVHRYLRDVEEVVIRAMGAYGVVAHRDADFTGVWVGSNKIAAIGVKVSRWTTMHGFALNVNTDLSFFDRIIPCGIFHRGVTSLEQCLGSHVSLSEVSGILTRHFGDVFGTQIVESSLEELPGLAEPLLTED